MVGGLFVILCAVVLHLVAFAGLRALVARSAGVRDVQGMLGIEYRSWAGVSLGRRALFAAAGPFACYLVAVVLLTVGMMLTGDSRIDETSMRVRVRVDSPAREAGLRDGDRIESVDGKRIRDWNELRAEIARHAGSPVRVDVERAGARVTLEATPGADGKIGVGPPMEVHPAGIGTAIQRGVVEPFRVVWRTLSALGRLVTGRETPETSSSVEVISATGRTAEAGAGSVLRYLGVVSSYFLFVPVLLVLMLFPRARARS